MKGSGLWKYCDDAGSLVAPAAQSEPPCEFPAITAADWAGMLWP